MEAGAAGVRLALDRCKALLELAKRIPAARCQYVLALQALENFTARAVNHGLTLDLIHMMQDLRELEARALDLDGDGDSFPLFTATSKVLNSVISMAIPGSDSFVSETLFASGTSKLSREQQELLNWFTRNHAVTVRPKASWLTEVNRAIAAIRWLSFRVDIGRNPAPLQKLVKAMTAGKKRKRKQDEDQEMDQGMEPAGDGKEGGTEAEKDHYDLMEKLCVHAASGQPSVDLKRLRRAQNQGEDISVLAKTRKTGIEMKRFLNKELTGTDLQRVLSLAAEIKQLLFYMLPAQGWSGRQVGALIFANLLFCVEAVFDFGKVQELHLSPAFPAFHGSKDPLLELYDRSRLYKSADPDVVFDKAPSDGFHGLVAYVNRVCELNGVDLAPLSFETDAGETLDVVVGKQLIYSGRNSVVLSCTNAGDDEPSSVIKVQPADDSCREERFHVELDNIQGVRRLQSSGIVLGAGAGLRFIQLAGYGSPCNAMHFSGSESRLQEFAEQACQALQGMHQCLVLHRDIKPDNFVVVEQTLLLNDFDLSCDFTDQLRRSMPVGTRMFMSPRLDGGGEYEPVDDWISLGLTFMHLTGLHRSEATKLVSLREILLEGWVPDMLKKQIQDWLQEMEEEE